MEEGKAAVDKRLILQHLRWMDQLWQQLVFEEEAVAAGLSSTSMEGQP